MNNEIVEYLAMMHARLENIDALVESAIAAFEAQRAVDEQRDVVLKALSLRLDTVEEWVRVRFELLRRESSTAY